MGRQQLGLVKHNRTSRAWASRIHFQSWQCSGSKTDRRSVFMAPIYAIALKNTFLEFKPIQEELEWEELPRNQRLRRSLSSPSSLSLSDDGSTTTASGSCASSDTDDHPSQGGYGTSKADRQCKTALAMQMKLNKELLVAGRDSGQGPGLFHVIRTQRHRMNAVNLSTSLHRVVRIGGPRDAGERAVLNALLNAIEKQSQREATREAMTTTHKRGSSMPAKCATIIAWSCASLQVFPPALFANLIQTVCCSLDSCKDFELPSPLAKPLPVPMDRIGGYFQKPLPVLMDRIGVYFQRRLPEMKGQILVSALVSFAALSSIESLSKNTCWLFQSVCSTLVVKSKELTFTQKTHVGVAVQIMREHNEQVIRDVREVAGKCPELASYFRV
eukprot:Skav225377  [mRNA]  locus=scaffold329:446282:450573:- [translate_table: standard]